MENEPMTKRKTKRPWWKFWQAPEAEPPKAISYHPEAKETGTTRTK